MKLPGVKFSDGIVKGKQIKFGGLNHNLSAQDGELWDMRNMTSDYYPLLASRAPRILLETLATGGGLYSWDGLCWIDGDGFYYKGERKGTVTDGDKTFTALGAYIVILPDKAYYNIDSDEFGSLESEWKGSSLTFTNGKLFDEDAEANTIQASGVNWNSYFKPGDAVTIAGCTKHPENNKTSIIREIDGNKLYFYEYIFTLEGGKGITPYSEAGTLSVKRSVPDLMYICENENRLWGCDRTTIYSSKLGDIFNWNVYDGLDTDSYAVDTGSAGIFTGCVSYLGYPIFFKEEHIYKVYGSIPSNYEIMGSATLGVAEGSANSLAIAGEMLFYMSRVGVMAFSGGIPQPVGASLGLERKRNAIAGSDGLKYYMSTQNEDGRYLLYVYDTQRRQWNIEDETHAKGFTKYNGNVYYLNDKGEIWLAGSITDPPGGTKEETVEWWAEFADYTDKDPNKNGIAKIQVRLELDPNSKAEFLIQFDTDGQWIRAGKVLSEDVKKSYYLPIIPRRGDHHRLRVEGYGGCRIYSIVREYYSGSESESISGGQ